ncbi:MAG: apolipoprotein N-acyltransferase [Gammaproteobacteria bacterium]|nr:apolipoprotein N-acyltransferase [Gammaproteobacteria bacterium]
MFLLGTGQIDSPLQHLLPIIGVLGVSWVTALSSSLLALAISNNYSKKIKLISLFLFVMLLILPLSLQNKTWTHALHTPISVAVIQADLSMRDQWDSAVYQKIESYYEKTAIEHMPKTNLIIMPESAIPLPSSYANHFLNTLHEKAKEHHSAVLLGIPHPSQTQPERYHNALVALGEARGIYAKQHLVPFGEYLPRAFSVITGWLGLPNANMMPGEAHQPAVRLNQHPFATLICYELAYPSLLRAQLPEAQFIVSLSDDGWFGHSLAVYQQLQLAQVLSKQTGRFQIVSNNNGLSSLINRNGKITDTLPAFSTGILGGTIYSATGVTPWVKTGDMPIVLINLCLLFIMLAFYLTVAAKQKSGYPNQPN